jgi:phage baseplate assembly protein W
VSKVPHLALPLRLDGSSFAEVEQDTTDDIAACVEAIVLTRPGDRDEIPDFGTTDAAFGQVDAEGRPVDAELLVDQIEEWEPRVRVLVDQAPERFDETARRVSVGAVTEE